MGWEFIAAGLFAAIIRFVLLLYGICLIASFAIILFLTRRMEGRKKWILRLVLPFPGIARLPHTPVATTTVFAAFPYRFSGRSGERWVRMKAKAIYEEVSYRLLFPGWFRIYCDRIEAYFWPFRYEIPFSEIRKIRIIDKIPWYVGWGLRVLPGRKLYFAIHHGKSVEIEKKGGYWRKIILSVKHPEKFIKIIEEARK